MGNKKQSYKESLAEIDNIIDKIENGDPDIDELSEMVKRAASLIKGCKQSLRKTQDDLDKALSDLE